MNEAPVFPMWVKSHSTRGEDHLGVQIDSFRIYSKLLPGLTSQTKRLRYYSFYPWILHRYAEEIRDPSDLTWREYIRRAEFMLALVSCAHHMENDQSSQGFVGANTAVDVVRKLSKQPKARHKISEWSSLSVKNRYFQHEQGGFGQYYKAVLASLELISLSDKSPGVARTKKGRTLAEMCDEQQGRSQFWKLVCSDHASFAEMQQLGDSLCPCRLTAFPRERQFLYELMFVPKTEYDIHGKERSSSLDLFLTLLSQSSERKDPVLSFRNWVYYGTDRIGSVISCPSRLSSTYQKWRIYEAGEYIHRSLEEIFFSFLNALRPGPILPNALVSSVVQRVLASSSRHLGIGTSAVPWKDRKTAELLREASKKQGSVVKWHSSSWSEENLIEMAIQEEDFVRKAAYSFACIVSLCSRNSHLEDPKKLIPGFQKHPTSIISLAEFRMFFQEHLEDNTVETLSAMCRKFILNRHLQVALSKLRVEGAATFKFIINDEGLYRWEDEFKPAYTRPRLAQALAFLDDLGLIRCDSNYWNLTPEGMNHLNISNVS